MIRRLSTAALVSAAALACGVAYRIAQHSACPACGRFARMSVKDGDLLFLRIGRDANQAGVQQSVEQVQHALSHRGIKPAMIWVVTEDVELSALGVEEMRKAGWIPLPPTEREMKRTERGLRHIEKQLSV